MYFNEFCEPSLYLVVVQYPACSWDYLQAWVPLLHRFLAIPVLCASGLQA